MTGINREYISQYISDLVPDYTGIIYDLNQEAVEEGVPIIGREVAQFLKTIIINKKIKKILEIGTATGFSGILMLSNTEGASLVTMEIDQGRIDQARENFMRAGFEDQVTIMEGPARDNIEKLEDKFDLVFIDGAKSDYKDLYERALKLLRPGGIIICDNVLFRGMVAQEDPDRRYRTLVRNMRSFLTYVFSLEEVISSLLPLGDGILISTRR